MRKILIKSVCIIHELQTDIMNEKINFNYRFNLSF